MDSNLFTKISQRLVVLAGILSLGTLSATPALADNHTDSMDSSTEMEEMPMNESTAQAGNIVEVASGNGSFNTLVQAVQAAGLVDTLSDSSASYTVFAPTDEAFEQLPEGALDYLLQPENQAVLQRVLSYHVVPQSLNSSEIMGGEIVTLDGGLATAVTDGRVIINNASVVTPDVEASNGVIHAVNRVLLPEDLQSALATELGVADIY
jgi:uncharacterized surface protein with fasciclin (FAS1) repeats